MLVVALATYCIFSNTLINDVLDRRSYRHEHERRSVTADVIIMDLRWPSASNIKYIVVDNHTCAGNTVDGYCDHQFSESGALVARQLIETVAAELHASSPHNITISEATTQEEVDTANEGGNDGVFLVGYTPECCHVHHIGHYHTSIPAALSQSSTNNGNYGVALTARSANVMCLGWCNTDIGAVRHEMLHILGVEHEHQSHYSSSLLTRCKKEACDPDWHNCRVLPAFVYNAPGFLDFRSIMFYSLKNARGCNLRLTSEGVAAAALQNVQSNEIGASSTFSSGDLEHLAAFYAYANESIVYPCPARTIQSCASNTICCPVSWIGDGECDMTAQCNLTCYDNDGWDCNHPTIPHAPKHPDVHYHSSHKHRSKRKQNNAFYIVAGLLLLLVFLLVCACR